MNDWIKDSMNELHKSACVFPLIDFSSYSATCLTSVWYLYLFVLARFFLFPERPWFLKAQWKKC